MPKRHGFFPLHWQMTLRTKRKKLDKWTLPRVGQLTVRIIFVPRGGGRGWGLGDSSQAPSTSAAGPIKWLELKHGLLEQTEKCHHFFFFFLYRVTAAVSTTTTKGYHDISNTSKLFQGDLTCQVVVITLSTPFHAQPDRYVFR